MTQDKDREELFKILRRKEVGVFTSDRDWNGFVDELTRWKRGDKWWCEHMKLIVSGSSKWWEFSFNTGEELLALTWKFCPICGAKRPGDNND